MRLIPVFILETYNPTINECLPKSVETDASLSLKIVYRRIFADVIVYIFAH